MGSKPTYEDLEREIRAYEATVANLEQKVAALAAENLGLNKFITQSCYVFNGDQHEISDAYVCATDGGMPENPATDAAITEIRAQGAYFVANRMLAAWDAGFIEDTAKNAADIARMALASVEFIPGAPAGDFDRSFSDGMLAEIAQQLREGAK